jgi:hypothetical protein
MRREVLAGMVGRARANAGGVKAAPEAFVLLAIVAFGIPYFGSQQSYGERLAVLEGKLASQEARLADYHSKLKGASPEQATAQIEKLTALTADLQRQLNAEKNKTVSVDSRVRDPQRLYERDKPVALVQDPKVDMAAKKVTVPVVRSGILLAMDRPYEYQEWKLACGGIQSYSELDDGAAPEFSYSHLICKIVGNR